MGTREAGHIYAGPRLPPSSLEPRALPESPSFARHIAAMLCTRTRTLRSTTAEAEGDKDKAREGKWWMLPLPYGHDDHDHRPPRAR